MIQSEMKMPKACGECPLKKTDNSRQEELVKRREMCRVLFNRCRAVVNAYGEMCMFCGLREECEAEHTV